MTRKELEKVDWEEVDKLITKGDYSGALVEVTGCELNAPIRSGFGRNHDNLTADHTGVFGTTSDGWGLSRSPDRIYTTTAQMFS